MAQIDLRSNAEPLSLYARTDKVGCFGVMCTFQLEIQLYIITSDHVTKYRIYNQSWRPPDLSGIHGRVDVIDRTSEPAMQRSTIHMDRPC